MCAQASATFEGLRVASERSEAALAQAQRKYLAVSSGLEDASESLQDLLMGELSTRISPVHVSSRRDASPTRSKDNYLQVR